MVPSFVGTTEERLKYESGEKALNDPAFVATYEAIGQIAPFLSDGYEAITYNDSQAMFEIGQAAMFIDGSWTLGVYGEDLAWGVFPVPGPTAESTAINFHPDMAITANPASAHVAEAQAFLEWISTEAGATVVSQYLPLGLFPMIDFAIPQTNAGAQEFLSMNDGRETDARFVWPAMMEMYTPMLDAVNAVIRGDMTAQEAADSVEAAKS